MLDIKNRLDDGRKNLQVRITFSIRVRHRQHLVDPTSNYGYSDGKAMYGWVIGSTGRYPADEQGQYLAERRMRSIFEIVGT